jgi:hypothetical protein
VFTDPSAVLSHVFTDSKKARHTVPRYPELPAVRMY